MSLLPVVRRRNATCVPSGDQAGSESAPGRSVDVSFLTMDVPSPLATTRLPPSRLGSDVGHEHELGAVR